MTHQFPVTHCPHCGSEDIGRGWQHGAVLYQCVAEPHKYPMAK